MLFVGAVVTFLVAYVVYTIVSSYGSEYADNSFYAFVDDTPSTAQPSTSESSKPNTDKYRKTYEQPGRQVLIIYATEYGFSKEMARELYDRIELSGSGSDNLPLQPRILDAKNFSAVDLMQESCLFVVISTAGDGVPPSEARKFVDYLMESQLNLLHLSYSVLALGDSNYVHFCRAGKTVDHRLQELGAQCIERRKDVDSEDMEAVHQWFDAVLRSLKKVEIETKFDYLHLVESEVTESTGPSRERPFSSVLKVKHDLTRNSSAGDKETIHCEFDVSDSGIVWTSGDALGIYPVNNSKDVDKLLDVIKCSGSTMVQAPRWAHFSNAEMLPVGVVLQHFYDLKNVKSELLVLLQRFTSNATSDRKSRLEDLLKNGIFRTNRLLQEYLGEREVVDILEDFEDIACNVDVRDLLGQMKALLPRYYSISSSPVVDPNRVCVTAAVLRYQTLGKDRCGVTTTFLQDRLCVGQSCHVFVSPNPNFRLPDDSSLPVIMIGPGTGLAPFRAFIQERVAVMATGLNLLYFGCRQKEQDFLYRTELENFVNSGALELQTAFSRAQRNKFYVQDLIREDSAHLWDLLSTGAHVYVCGDARHMAHDVHAALCDVVKNSGGMTGADDAENFLSALEKKGRYQKDTWVT